jgi:nucleoid DNA-binding protein
MILKIITLAPLGTFSVGKRQVRLSRIPAKTF